MSAHEESTFLEEYDPTRYPRPSVTVDLVILTVRDAHLKVLLVQRKEHPYRHGWALPGGFVRVKEDPLDQGESLLDAAHRELAEETGLPLGAAFLEQLYTFGKPGRDPRTRVISVAWYALIQPELAPLVTAGSDAAHVAWYCVSQMPAELAFDHQLIVNTAIERIRGKIDYAPIAFNLVPETFTVAELRAAYGAVKGQPYDAGNFRRRFLRMLEDGLVEQAPGLRHVARKPSTVYRFVTPARVGEPG